MLNIIEINKIIEMYKTMSIKDISKEMNLDGKTISKYLKANNVPIRSRSETLKITKKLSKQIEQTAWNTKKERDKLVVKMYKNGYGSLTIAKSLHISKKTVLNILKNKNISRNNVYRQQCDINQVIELYKSGKSLSEIGIITGVSEHILCNVIPKNIKRSPGETMCSLLGAENDIINMYKSGMSTYDIAKELKIHNPDTIARLLRKRKLTRSKEEQRKLVALKLNNDCFKSSLHDVVESIFNELNIDYKSEFSIDGWNYDYKVGERYLLEIQSYWHLLPGRVNRDKIKNSIAKKNNYKLLYIWQEQIQNKEYLLNFIKHNFTINTIVDFDFNDVKIEQDYTCARNLIENYHYSFKTSNATYNYVAFYKNKPIATCTFGAPTRQEIAEKQHVQFNEILELTRFVIHPEYQKKNFASWFIGKCIKYLKKLNKYKVLVSFSDGTYNHIGSIYKASNWIYDGTVKSNYWYIKNKRTVIHKKKIWNLAKKEGISESDYANKNNLLKVYGLEKNRYIYVINK